jgi:hypothetical protein
MPDIEFKDLSRSIGTELFTDPESFLEDLSEDTANIVGGFSTGVATIALPQTTVATTVIRADDHPIMRTTVYRPSDGDGKPVSYTPYHTTVHKPHRPRYHRPIHPTFVTNDI